MAGRLTTGIERRQVCAQLGSVRISNFSERDCVRSTSRSTAAGLRHSRAPTKLGHYAQLSERACGLSSGTLASRQFFKRQVAVGTSEEKRSDERNGTLSNGGRGSPAFPAEVHLRPGHAGQQSAGRRRRRLADHTESRSGNGPAPGGHLGVITSGLPPG